MPTRKHGNAIQNDHFVAQLPRLKRLAESVQENVKLMSSVHVQSPTKLSTLSRRGATRFSAEPRWRSAAPFNEVHAYLPHASTLRRNRAHVLRAPIDTPRSHTTTRPHAYLTSPTKLSTLRRTGSAVFGPRPSSRTAYAPTAFERKGIELRAAAVEIQRIVDSARAHCS